MSKLSNTVVVAALLLSFGGGEALAGHCRAGNNRNRIQCLNKEVAYLTTKWKQTQRDLDALKAELPNLSAAAVPIGTVMPWFSKDEILPKGWALCDGLEGRPNLNETYIVGTEKIDQVGERINDENSVIDLSTETGVLKGNNNFNWGRTDDKAPVATGTDHKHDVTIKLDRAKLAPKSVKMRYIIKIM